MYFNVKAKQSNACMTMPYGFVILYCPRHCRGDATNLQVEIYAL